MTTVSHAFPSGEWLAALRRRGTEPAFAAARAALDERLAGYHRVLPDLPSRQAGYYHDFFCPTHAVQLVFDPREPHRHACPIHGEVHSGEPFDSAWGWSVNDMLSDAALRAAVRLAMATGGRAQRDTDLALVRHVLAGYAERYRLLPPSPIPYPGPYRGVACFSALDEDVFIIRLAWAFALTRVLLPGDAVDLVRTGLLEPAREHLARVRYRQVQNVANWDNSALLTLALVLDDGGAPAIDEIVDGEFGVRDELARGVGTDGLWWEVSLSYHYYVLAALSWTVRGLRAARRSAPDVERVVRAMFRAPLELAFPDSSLPAINDCWYHIGLLGEVGHGIPSSAGLHELAWAWFGEPDFGRVLGANAARSGRVTLEALLDGSDMQPTTDAALGQGPGVALADLAVLRSDALTVILKAAGGDGDAHGHPDQLGLALYGAGGRIAIDPGTPGYGIALNDTWYRQTGAHSTVLLDGASQPPAAASIDRVDPAEGRAELSVRWPVLERWAAVADRTRAIEWPQAPSRAYAGVEMQRWVDVRGSLLTDRFRVDAPAERTIDWLLHIRGTFDGLTEPAPRALAGPCGYDELADIRVVTDRGPLHFELPAGRLIIDFERLPGEVVLLASAPGNPAADRHLLLVRRHRAHSTTFRARLLVESSGSPDRRS